MTFIEMQQLAVEAVEL